MTFQTKICKHSSSKKTFSVKIQNQELEKQGRRFRRFSIFEKKNAEKCHRGKYTPILLWLLRRLLTYLLHKIIMEEKLKINSVVYGCNQVTCKYSRFLECSLRLGEIWFAIWFSTAIKIPATHHNNQVTSETNWKWNIKIVIKKGNYKAKKWHSVKGFLKIN